MYLGIEIGGTKLQFGVGPGGGEALAAIERLEVDVGGGAGGILEQIRRVGRPWIDEHDVHAVGVGFGGPVAAKAGRTVHSFQVDGWDDFPLADWCRRELGVPAVVGNDSDLAGLGEARFGAGRGASVVFYSNVGSGIGGALVLDGHLHAGAAGVAAELGHLRPGLDSCGRDATVESLASGWAISAAAVARMGESPNDPAADELLTLAENDVNRITARLVAEAYAEGNPLAREVFLESIRVYGWALAQMITLVAPEVVVIGGGVPLLGESLYLAPLREQVERYVFPPLRESYRVVPATLGEEVVVHGALALARDVGERSNDS